MNLKSQGLNGLVTFRVNFHHQGQLQVDQGQGLIAYLDKKGQHQNINSRTSKMIITDTNEGNVPSVQTICLSARLVP